MLKSTAIMQFKCDLWMWLCWVWGFVKLLCDYEVFILLCSEFPHTNTCTWEELWGSHLTKQKHNPQEVIWFIALRRKGSHPMGWLCSLPLTLTSKLTAHQISGKAHPIMSFKDNLREMINSPALQRDGRGWNRWQPVEPTYAPQHSESGPSHPPILPGWGSGTWT